MQINRQSYEEYFLLYADGELNESEMRAVEEFIDQNPDLAGELSIIQETVVKPDGSIVFENKELLFKHEAEEKKVIYMRWFRIAAAAAVLIALTLTGWIFTGNRNAAHVVISKNQKVQKAEPKEIISSVETKDAPAKQETASTEKESNVIIRSKIKPGAQSNIQPGIQTEDKVIIDEPYVAKDITPAKPVEAAAVTEHVIDVTPEKETIDVAVAPRAMDNNVSEQPHNDVSYAQSFPQQQDDDMIYFANTSLTKKTKLRGVLRKATRYLDRVTSLQ